MYRVQRRDQAAVAHPKQDLESVSFSIRVSSYSRHMKSAGVALPFMRDLLHSIKNWDVRRYTYPNDADIYPC